jgi:hypothetical protein
MRSVVPVSGAIYTTPVALWKTGLDPDPALRFLSVLLRLTIDVVALRLVDSRVC